MFVKKFEAESIEAGLALAKQELGPDALVLSTQHKKAKWFGRPSVELTVAAPPKTPQPAAQKDDALDEAALAAIFPHRQNAVAAAAAAAEEREEDEKEEVPARARSVRKTRLSRYLDVAGDAPAESEPEPASRPPSGDRNYEHYEQQLRSRGFSEKSARELVRRLIFDYSREDRRHPQQVRRILSRLAAKSIQTVSPTLFESRKVWTALGVGGVGKTSLSVKMALALKKRHFNVTLVGRDDRKIVAQRQLSSYAKLIHVPFARESTSVHAERVVQLIDTPALHIKGTPEEEAELLDICRGTNTYIVLDASWRLSEMLRVVESARRFAPAAVAFTRLDLSVEHGVIFDLLKQTNLPLLGLSVSSSFQSPFKFYEPEELAAFLLREESNG